MYFCTAFSLKIFKKKTPIGTEKIFGKTVQVHKQAVGNLEPKVYVNRRLG